MAKSLLFGVAESLIEKLASRACEEVSLALGECNDLQEIKETLSFIKAVLLDAEQKQEHNHWLRVWLQQIKRVFSDAEDILDDFECEALRKHVVNTYGSTKRKVCRFFSSSNPFVYRHKMGCQIKEIKRRLDKVAADRDKFGLEINDIDKRVVQRREMTHSHVIASNVIGREHDKEKIIELLLQHHLDGDDKSLSIIPIVGIGGLGKTKLAQLVFNDKSIDESFPLKLWVRVSDDFDLKQVTIKILKSATVSTFSPISTLQENFQNLNLDELQHRLRDTLAGQKFLLVLDDVWNEDLVKWIELKDLIQVDAEGSKVLVTTRSHSIAAVMGTNPSYILQGLSQKDSLSLFVKWAFKEGEEKRYPELVEIGKQIVEKCGGLPQAVRTLGSLLFSNVDVKHWEFVRDSEIWKLPQKYDDILPALKLSYDQMPSYLKRCFDCFSLFQKDHDFSSIHVTDLWGALGLLQSPNKSKTLEDVGIQYLYELQSRSFLQDFVDFGSFCTFKLHDLVHDLALFVAKDEFQLLNSHNQNISDNARHLSFIENDLLGQASIPTGVRTVIFPFRANNEAFLNTVASRCKDLRVLDLGESEYEILPRSIGKLKHLRHLSLSGNKKLKRLPDSVCKLQSLQLLTLDGCIELQTLPKGLRNLIRLRQLYITTKQSDFPESEIAKLTSLELLYLESCDNLAALFEGIRHHSLKCLGISSCRSLKSLPHLVKHIPNLESLHINSCDMLELSSLDNQIPELRLKLLRFESLPQLLTLPQWLQGFTNTLDSLIIQDCDNLEELPEWLSALICLKRLCIVYCPKLLSLPDDMHRLTNLEILKIGGCPELCRRYQPEVGQYWPKISHIKHVDIGEP